MLRAGSGSGGSGVVNGLGSTRFINSQIPVVLLGDSITAQHVAGSASQISASSTTRGYVNWVNFKLGNPFYFPMGYDGNLPYDTGSISGTGRPVGHNAGIGSDKLPGMISRLQTDVIALNPAICFFHAGTNDLQGGDTAANIKANFATIIDRLLAASIHPVVTGILARNATDGAGVDFDATKRLRRCDINRYVKAYCMAKGATYIDPDIAFCNPATGDANTGYTGEGLHPNSVGAEYIADTVLAAITRLNIGRPYRDLINNVYDVYDATENPFGNLLPNADLSGTAGTAGTNVTGSVADTWTAEMTSGSATSTVVASKSTVSIYGNSIVTQKFVVTHDGLGLSSETLRFKHTTPATITTAAANGTWVQGSSYLKLSAPTGTKNVISAMFLLEDQSDGRFSRNGLYRDTGVYMIGAAREGLINGVPKQLKGTTGLKWNYQFVFDNTISGTTTIEVALPMYQVCPVTPPWTYYV